MLRDTTPSKPTPPGTRRPSPDPETLNRLGDRDVPSPHLPRPRNARHQSGTSPVLPQPVFKTLKGFQTVAGGKAARPPPPVPCPQNVQPPPLAEGVGGGGTPEFPQAVSPDASRCSALPRLRNQHPLGRDVPAPTRSINYFGVGDVPSPHLPRPPNARHQFGTSPALPQPAFKTLKGFQTVAGGKAVRPPPPVPRPQNIQPPPLAEGVGGGGIPETPQAASPDASRCSAIPRLRNQHPLGRDVPAPIPRPSIASGIETSRLHTSHELATPVISPGLPLSFPNPSSKP